MPFSRVSLDPGRQLMHSRIAELAAKDLLSISLIKDILTHNVHETAIEIKECRGKRYAVLPFGFSFTDVVSDDSRAVLADLALASLTKKYSPGMLPDGFPYDKIPGSVLYLTYHFVPLDEFVGVAAYSYPKYAY